MTEQTQHFNNILEACLNAITEQGKSIEECLQQYPQERTALEPLLRLTLRLDSARSIGPSSEFRQSAAARMDNLIAASPRKPQPAAQPAYMDDWGSFFRNLFRRTQRSFSPVLAVIIVLVLVLGSGTGVAFASNSSLPGDNLYPVKIWVENTRLGIAGSGYADARLHLDFAGRRVTEAQTLLKEKRSADIQQSVSSYSEHMKAAVSALSKDSGLSPQEKVVVASQIVQTLDAQRSVFQEMNTELPADMQQMIDEAQQMALDAQEMAIEIMNEWPDLVDLPGGIPTMPSLPAAASSTPEPPSSTEEGWPTDWPTGEWTEWPVGTPTVWMVDMTWPQGCPTAWPTGWPSEWQNCFPTTWPTGIPTNFPTQWPTYWPTEWATYVPTNWQSYIPTAQYLPSLIPTLVNLPTQIATYLPNNWATYIPTGFPQSWPTLPIHPPSSWPTPDWPGGGGGGGGNDPEPPPGWPHWP